MLETRPSGKTTSGLIFTHELKDIIVCGKIVGRNVVLAKIKSVASQTQPDKEGWKHITIYKVSSAEKGTGNWLFPDGKISLQNLIDQFDDPEAKYSLTIHNNTSYASWWTENLADTKKGHVKCQSKGNLRL